MIRKAYPSEIDDILAITKACAVKMVSEGIYQWNEFYPNKTAFKKDVEREELYAIILNNAVIGCVVITPIKDAEYDSIKWLTEDSSNYYIHRLAIHPNYQNQGFAKHVMDFAETFVAMNGGKSVRLDTFSKNLRNQRFYEARGYKRLGEIYFPKQSDSPFYCYELVI